jgi:hypothetical protein
MFQFSGHGQCLSTLPRLSNDICHFIPTALLPALQGEHPADDPGQHEYHGPCWLVSGAAVA